MRITGGGRDDQGQDCVIILVHVGTFHSSCARWLREFASELGFSSDFTIYDDRDSIQALKGVLKKLNINAPHEILLVLDGSTGQNAYEQAKQFSEATEITSMMVTKLDGTAKGGVVIGISDQLSIPIKFIGTGESIDDIEIFDKKQFVESFFKKKIK